MFLAFGNLEFLQNLNPSIFVTKWFHMSNMLNILAWACIDAFCALLIVFFYSSGPSTSKHPECFESSILSVSGSKRPSLMIVWHPFCLQ